MPRVSKPAGAQNYAAIVLTTECRFGNRAIQQVWKRALQGCPEAPLIHFIDIAAFSVSPQNGIPSKVSIVCEFLRSDADNMGIEGTFCLPITPIHVIAV